MADDLGSRELRALWYRWQEKRNKDVIEAALKKEEDLTDLEIQTNFSWPQVWNAPPFLVPQNATNAETINAILIKSWETQGSSCTGLPKITSRFGKEANVLFENKGFKIIALLNYYFKNMPMVTVNISRKVGLLQSSGPDPVTVPWSFLQISHLYEIDNSFSVTGTDTMSDYSKSQIFVQKFNFDKTPTFSLWLLNARSRASTLDGGGCFHEFFT